MSSHLHLGRAGDPLYVGADEPEPTTVRVSGDSEAYFRAWNAGFDEAWSQLVPRRVWLAVIVATIALILAAFQAGRTYGSTATSEVRSTPAPVGGGSSAASLVPGAPYTAGSDASATARTTSSPSGAPPPQPTRVPRGTELGGQATWWDTFGPGLYAAIRPDLGTKGDTAVVCGGKPWHCLTVPIITTCACLGPGSDRLIDLSLDAFVEFAPPGLDQYGKPRRPGWQGVVRVVVQVNR